MIPRPVLGVGCPAAMSPVRPAAARSLALCLLLLAACGRERVVASACREDPDCETGLLCEDYRCVPANTKACEVVLDGNPVLQPAPYAANFGDVDVPDSALTLQLHNIGNCTLTLYEMGLEKGADSPFTCEACSGSFPVEIFPGRSRDVKLGFRAKAVGAVSDSLKILSDDREFSELKVPIRANFLGIPDLRVAPNPVDFGFVAQATMKAKTVRITNNGTGVAGLTVESIALDPPATEDFELVGLPELPLALPPVGTDESAIHALELRYHPRTSAQHAVALVVTSDKGVVRVPVSGSALGPPKLNLNPASIDLGNVPLGTTNVLPLTLTNEGGSPLQVTYTWGGPSPTTDLFATPLLVPAVAPGAYTTLNVAFTATSAGPVSGLLMLSTNDPTRPSVTVQVNAVGVPGPGPQVVKVEMVYDNGSDSAFDSDLRNVDLTLEHPFGFVCNKQNPSPTNWGAYGSPAWISFAPKEEPERIVLPGVTQDGTFRVMLSYQEDCASLPTDLAAGLLGISVDVLIAYLSGGASIPVGGAQVGQLIGDVCLSKKNSNATVRVYTNGALIKEKTVSLSKKGDTTYALDLVRTNGVFTAK
jgi:hypothetical protein